MQFGDGALGERPDERARIGAMNPLMKRLSSAMAVPSGGVVLVWSSSPSMRIPGTRIARGFCGVRASVGREIEQNGGVAAVSSGRRSSDYLPPRFR